MLEKAREIAAAQVAERCHFVHGYYLVQVLFYVYDGGVYHAAFLNGLFRANALLLAGERVYLYRDVCTGSVNISRKTSQPPFIAHHPRAIVNGAGDDILHNGIYHVRDTAYALILHLGQTLVQLAQIGLQGAHRVVGMDCAYLVDKALHSRVGAVRDAHLPEHHCAEVLIANGYRYGDIHNAAVAQIDERLIEAYRLQPGERIALLAAFAGYGVFADDTAEIRAHAVLRDGRPLVVYRDYSGACRLCELILYRLPAGNVQYGFYVEFALTHLDKSLLIHRLQGIPARSLCRRSCTPRRSARPWWRWRRCSSSAPTDARTHILPRRALHHCTAASDSCGTCCAPHRPLCSAPQCRTREWSAPPCP